MKLDSNHLAGPIPPELGELSDLKRLKLNNNLLTGSIPFELGRLSNLESLHLASNRLSGCIPSALEDVADNDLDLSGLTFCAAPDMALNSLSVGPRALVPEFDPKHIEYTTTSGVSPVTVTAATDADSTIRILDDNGDEIADANAAREGHQVEIGEAGAVIKVEVTSGDAQTVETYTITVAYEDLLKRYDTDGSGTIEREEAIVAVADFFGGAIGREEALAVIALYFSSV